MSPPDDKLIRLEERIAHLEHALDEASAEAVALARRVEMLERRLALVLERLAQAEFDEGGTVPLADWRPPHW